MCRRSDWTRLTTPTSRMVHPKFSGPRAACLFCFPDSVLLSALARSSPIFDGRIALTLQLHSHLLTPGMACLSAAARSVFLFFFSCLIVVNNSGMHTNRRDDQSNPVTNVRCLLCFEQPFVTHYELCSRKSTTLSALSTTRTRYHFGGSSILTRFFPFVLSIQTELPLQTVATHVIRKGGFQKKKMCAQNSSAKYCTALVAS